jgi:uncharacterized protein YndB with AHSA1/START domain
MAEKNNPSEIRITREYDAPVKAVWEAWTEPAQLAQWWGPRGFTITTHSKELRPGGTWRYVMHGPDGVDYPNLALYHEVVPPTRLVYDHGATDNTPPLFKVTVHFSERAGKTRMEMTMTFPSPEAAGEARKFIRKAGGDSTWDRLSEFVQKRVHGKDRFEINRSFEAPIGVVFDMWTDPQHFTRWLPPTGFTMKFLRADIRPGGDGFYAMTDGGSMTMYGRVQYREIERPGRIVYTQQFCDEKGNVSRHPMAPTWPETMLTVVTLSEEGPERTRVTVNWEPIGAVKPEELATFLKERAGMTRGWTGSFDKLEALL